MKRKPYMPKTVNGINMMLAAFDTNINANSGALATKYNVDAAELARIAQGRLVWTWFILMAVAGKHWTISVNNSRDMMEVNSGAGPMALPGGPMLPPVPMIPGTPPTAALLDPGFIPFFCGLVARIKAATNYDAADGLLLGIQGAEILPPGPVATVPAPEVDLTTGGQPEITCKKGLFQGFDVSLTRPGQARKPVGFSTGRHFVVTEPLPAAGTAEIWVFDVQYRYQNLPFGQISQSFSITVRG